MTPANFGTPMNRGRICGIRSSEGAPNPEILLVQGLIQTAAMLLHHQRKNAVGVSKQWAKLQPKLEGWAVAWGLDVATHLRVIETYADDEGTWDLVATDHQVPRA